MGLLMVARIQGTPANAGALSRAAAIREAARGRGAAAPRRSGPESFVSKRTMIPAPVIPGNDNRPRGQK
jgi:hypothetical protein